ncbi:MAG: formate dehydrogenase accessory sulfurtransferase FdhD [Deltaproteobacteria bacterium]|nr:formate dehydrogenase accessory sulfurtransferase FdhD [Deltaproteobacteria bacterium]
MAGTRFRLVKAGLATAVIRRLAPDGRAGEETPDLLAAEEAFSLVLGGRPRAVLEASPGGEAALAAGYCLTMGLLDPAAPAPRVAWDPAARTVTLEAVALAQAPAQRRRPPREPGAFPATRAAALPEVMRRRQESFERSGATHAAALFNRAGEMLVLAEDLGRHSALDKAAGTLWLAGELGEAWALALSGRCNLEMLEKAARSGVELVASVSAATAAAAARAGELGLTLLGFCRSGRANIYSHPARLSYSEGDETHA